MELKVALKVNSKILKSILEWCGPHHSSAERIMWSYFQVYVSRHAAEFCTRCSFSIWYLRKPDNRELHYGLI